MATDEAKARGERLRKAARMKDEAFTGATPALPYLRRFIPKLGLNTLTSNMNGNASFSYKRAEQYGEAFGVRPEWLYSGTLPIREEAPDDQRQGRIPLIGRVAAETTNVVYQDAYAPGAALDWLDASAPDGSIALEIEGESMLPRFRPGEIVIFGYQAFDLTPHIGQEVLASLKDERKVIKTLRRGSREGLYDLLSYNAANDPIRDAEVDWVLPFIQLRPRRH